MNYLKMLEKTYHQGCFSAIALDKVVLKTVLVLDDLDFPDRCQKKSLTDCHTSLATESIWS